MRESSTGVATASPFLGGRRASVAAAVPSAAVSFAAAAFRSKAAVEAAPSFFTAAVPPASFFSPPMTLGFLAMYKAALPTRTKRTRAMVAMAFFKSIYLRPA
jgi:hypothetical protein